MILTGYNWDWGAGLGLCSTSSLRWEKKHCAYFTCASVYSFFHVHVATPSVCVSLKSTPSIFQPGPHCLWVLLGSHRHCTSPLFHVPQVTVPVAVSQGWRASAHPWRHSDGSCPLSPPCTMTEQVATARMPPLPSVLAAYCYWGWDCCSSAVLGAVNQSSLPPLGSELPFWGRENGLGVGYCGCSEPISSPPHSFLMFWTTVSSEQISSLNYSYCLSLEEQHRNSSIIILNFNWRKNNLP